MGTIDIGIRHDHDSAVAQPAEIKTFADPGAQRRDQGFYLTVVEDFVKASSLGIENLAAKGKNCLEMSVPALFGRTTSRVTLNDIKFSLLRISFRTIRQFTR